MSTPSSVVGCSSCGALHTPAPGDRGLCSACRRLLVSDVPWRADATGADPRNGGGASPKRPEKEKLARVRPIRDRSWRRIAIGAGVAVIVAGLGAGVAVRRQPLADSWTKIERHMKTGAWSSLRRRVTALWASLRHETSDAWIAVRRHLPFGGAEGKGRDSIATPAPSRTGGGDATVARGTHRRKTASTRRSRDD